MSLKRPEESPFRDELFSPEKLQLYATFLASELEIQFKGGRGQPLLPRLQSNSQHLLACYRQIAAAVHLKETISPAAEWLIDNYHIIEDQIREIQEDLPSTYYYELPKISQGELKGYPRIYALAIGAIAHTDSHLELGTLQNFIQAFQKKSELKIGELWAFPISLRIGLVENARRIADAILWDRARRQKANSLADELIELSTHPDRLPDSIGKIKKTILEAPPQDCAFIAQLAKRLRDQEVELWPALNHLEACVQEKDCQLDQIIQMDHHHQAANQVTMSHIVTSMRLLSSLDWKYFFESVSLTHQCLLQDPSGLYGKMDFATRNRYRNVIEDQAKQTRCSETEIAKAVVQLASSPKNPRSLDGSRNHHIGYYLIGPGLYDLRLAISCRPRFLSRIRETIHNHSQWTYFGFLTVLTLLFESGLILLLNQTQLNLGMILLLSILFLVPLSDVALTLQNLILSSFISPQTLPKMDFTTGVPDQRRSLVVIPCLLQDLSSLSRLLEKLEIHYLGNRDPQIYFALLTDFTDSLHETEEQDTVLLTAAMKGIENLNRKYPSSHGAANSFHLFHRRRVWNPSERKWMGWERKRGKLHELNRLLRGESDTTFVKLNSFPSLPLIRYIITLDADTHLPRDMARRLIETISHPLNQALADEKTGKTVEGYAIIQPRVSMTLESSSQSLFSQIFSGYTGIDPYTTAVSNPYQDLFDEGIYTGKGIYEIDSFEASLKGRFPENAILSHDLIEGLHARVGLATDIEIFDDYPASYASYYKRQHRWTRGDWQILPWLLPWVPSAKNSWIRNPLSLVDRWKIADNLRRSLVAPTTWFSYVAIWISLPQSSLPWILGLTSIVAFPSLAHMTNQLLIHTRRVPWTSEFWQPFQDLPTSISQALLSLIFLPHQACVQGDAIARALYRKLLSHQNLLEWVPASQLETENSSQAWQTSSPTFCILALSLTFITLIAPTSLYLALPFYITWFLYPVIARHISRPLQRTKLPLDVEERYLLRLVVRRTWHFFESFVSSDTHWLPPDNFQEDPKPVLAERTSPTNIGLYLLSIISAHDFGYLSGRLMLHRLQETLNTLQKMEKCKGHFLNWYDTRTLLPLKPRYVSTVDSGNLAGHLYSLEAALREVQEADVISVMDLRGLADLFGLLILEADKHNHQKTGSSHFSDSLSAKLRQAEAQLNQIYSPTWRMYESLLKELQAILRGCQDISVSASEFRRWTELGLAQISDLQDLIALFAPWISHQEQNPALAKIFNSLDSEFKYKNLANAYSQMITDDSLSESLASAFKRSRAECQEFIRTCEFLITSFARIRDEMDFSFLLQKDRSVFSIGYNVEESRYDTALYDLLASESRLASFIAIAKGDVFQEHWFRLGRQLVATRSGRALVSWTASMFEYLMPQLVMRCFANTILDETLHTIVQSQIRYAEKIGIPWGISEAGYNTRDLQLNYQYGPFGIPGLGLKRGLSQDLVVSPYSTFLAALIAPHLAVKNIRRLIQEDLLRAYGFYEAVDYTSERIPEGQSRAIIRSFMAHHQGMSLVAANNVLNQNIMQTRFHSSPEIRTTQLLLQERIPHHVSTRAPKAASIELDHQAQIPTAPYRRTYTNPSQSPPPIQLLSNGQYSLMISSSGSGYAKCGPYGVYRWREDATCDSWGQFIYLKDLDHKTSWSTGFQPTLTPATFYHAILGEDKVEISRQDFQFSTKMEIIVSPEDNVEIRQVTVTNHSQQEKRLEVTSYLEPVLAPMNSDTAHPAFSKLFLQTDYLPSKQALLAKRRKRSEHDKEIWGFHLVATDGTLISPIQFETDRSIFLGRGNSPRNPAAMSAGNLLSGSKGVTLDPIFSLRAQVLVPAGQSVSFNFVTGLTFTSEEALHLVDRYQDPKSFQRERELAWTKARVDLFHLGIDAPTAYLYQRLAETILFSNPGLRPPSHHLHAHLRGQSSLWPFGISGDLPIVVLRVYSMKDLVLLKELLKAHEYLRLKGLVYDFVILNEQKSSYLQHLQDDILNHLKYHGGQNLLNKHGGFYCLRTDTMQEIDKAFILSVARIVLKGGLGSLQEQINHKRKATRNPPAFRPTRSVEKGSRAPEPSPLSLLFFNGLGGFNAGGTEYVIQLRPGSWTPAPWINVIANQKGFGFQISESGSSYTWNINSRENRLTPWSNDPVMDPSGEVIYIRDEETGEFWNPTPLPRRESQTTLIQHGFGYTSFSSQSHGITQSLVHFVPEHDAVKVSILTLKNNSNRKRHLSVTSYIEWVLGVLRENSSPYIICEQDEASGAIFARNPFNNEFGELVSFHAVAGDEKTFTCDRQEFIGRNGNLHSPAALFRQHLSGNKGTGQDPCAAFQTSFWLDPQQEKEIVILLGQDSSRVQIHQLIQRYLDPRQARLALDEVQKSWKKRLQIIQVRTPDPALDILVNGWLLYQTLSCRFWARTAFYQSGGAYGYRDQLQDCMALVYASPSLCREHIFKCAEHQFPEGDVQHWWHPPSGRGVRTRMVDDLLWLPFVTSFYIEKTGDASILDEVVPFIEAPLLTENQEDSYTQPHRSEQKVTLLEHCLRALDRSLHKGPHGLPLIGTGDWNDGMNRVGHLGRGESIWMGWFLSKVLVDFLKFSDLFRNETRKKNYENHLTLLKSSLESEGWDGEWYRRAYFDDGQPLGSILSQECQIDSLPQSWAVLSGIADSERQRTAMDSAALHLLQNNSRLVLLFTPPFDQTPEDPGYIKGYVPGVRENGGQYTHAAIWMAMAFAQLGDGQRAYQIWDLLNPIHHSNPQSVNKYKAEPYAIAADIYSVPPHTGRGGWSWYTGSASWYYRAALESILGFHLAGNELKFRPVIPENWEEFEIKYSFGTSVYQIQVRSQTTDSVAEIIIFADGLQQKSDVLQLVDDGQTHHVTVTIRSRETSVLSEPEHNPIS